MEWPDTRTTGTAMAVWRRAAQASLVDITEDRTELIPKVKHFLQMLDDCENFRTEYREIVEEFTSIMAMASNEQALDMAQAGLDALHDLLQFRMDEYTLLPAKDAFVLTTTLDKLPTSKVTGTRLQEANAMIDFKLPLINPNQRPGAKSTLYRHEACAQVDAWANYGVLETSASVLAKTALVCKNLPTILTKKKFCLLGCTSELGPAKSLLLIPNATVLGVCRQGKKLDKLLDYVKSNSPESTTLLYPEGGADLLTQAPQIAQWIIDQTDPKDELVLMPLAYADGEKCVRVCVAMDLIIQRITRQRHKSTICQYNSPTTVMVLPPAAATAAKNRLESRPVWEKMTRMASFGNWLQPSLPDTTNADYTILNGVASAQGPNYLLAKTMQMWRCMIAHYRDSLVVAAPFAPITRTNSVVTNGTIGAAVEGMHHFEPMLAFDVGPASTLMAAIMLSQLQTINRPLPDVDESPFCMFWEGSVHGGTWTCPYTLESISSLNWILGKTYYPKGYIPPEALPTPVPEGVIETGDEEQIFDLEEMMQDSMTKEKLPDFVKERLDFM